MWLWPRKSSSKLPRKSWVSCELWGELWGELWLSQKSAIYFLETHKRIRIRQYVLRKTPLIPTIMDIKSPVHPAYKGNPPYAVTNHWQYVGIQRPLWGKTSSPLYTYTLSDFFTKTTQSSLVVPFRTPRTPIALSWLSRGIGKGTISTKRTTHTLCYIETAPFNHTHHIGRGTHTHIPFLLYGTHNKEY